MTLTRKPGYRALVLKDSTGSRKVYPWTPEDALVWKDEACWEDGDQTLLVIHWSHGEYGYVDVRWCIGYLVSMDMWMLGDALVTWWVWMYVHLVIHWLHNEYRCVHLVIHWSHSDCGCVYIWWAIGHAILCVCVHLMSLNPPITDVINIIVALT